MKTVRARFGFTLVELLMATFVSMIVLTAIGTSFLTAQRMLRTAMAEAELSLASRQLRNRLLFQASPPVDGSVYAGLLSATNLNDNQLALGVIQMSGGTVGATLQDVDTQSIRLSPSTFDGQNFILNEGTPEADAHRGWLWPSEMVMSKCDFSEIVNVAPYEATRNFVRLYVDLALETKPRVMGISPVARTERIMIPLMGKLQPMSDKNTNGRVTY